MARQLIGASVFAVLAQGRRTMVPSGQILSQELVAVRNESNLTGLGAGLGSSAETIGPSLGGGKTTRYWDCCKPSCAWSGKAQVSNPVQMCNKEGNSPMSGVEAESVCLGGNAYMCNQQQPFNENGQNYGFAAANVAGGSESSWCCACYNIQAAGGKSIIVQVTNTGSDLGENHFDIQIPGGGFGKYDGCTKQWEATETTWGARYGGTLAASLSCSGLPSELHAGCNWANEHWSDNPHIESLQRVKCPATLTDKTGCKRSDE